MIHWFYLLYVLYGSSDIFHIHNNVKPVQPGHYYLIIVILLSLILLILYTQAINR